MLTGILSITAAILLSIVSAFFSVSGITTIFSGAAISAGVMGGVLELSKIAATIWLYNFWKKAAFIMKAYFFAAIVILIMISSIGIYGYLAKAYVGQEAVGVQIDTRIERYQNYIDRELASIERAEEQLDLLDRAIEQYIDINVISRGLDRRENQREEREQLTSQIEEAEQQIAEYEDQIFELQTQKDTAEVNVGPIRYIAAAIYGEERAEQYYDNAVRILIILFMVVFDPFAVLLMVAGNIALEKKKRSNRARHSTKKKPAKPPKKEEPTPVSTAPDEPVEGGTQKPVAKPTNQSQLKTDPPRVNGEPPKLTRKVRRTRKP